jgi:hypothetical protein
MSARSTPPLPIVFVIALLVALYASAATSARGQDDSEFRTSIVLTDHAYPRSCDLDADRVRSLPDRDSDPDPNRHARAERDADADAEPDSDKHTDADASIRDLPRDAAALRQRRARARDLPRARALFDSCSRDQAA